MSDLSLKDFSELTARLYDTATDELLWSDAIRALKAKFNVSQSSMGWVHQGKSRMLHDDCDNHYSEVFFNLGSANFFLPMVAKSQAGTVFQDGNLLPRDEFERSAVFNEWYAPQREHSTMVVKFDSSPGNIGFLTLHRGGSQPKFSERDMALVEQLTPILMHALALRRRLELARLQQRGAADDARDIGFVVTDASGLILQHNETAGRQFAQGDAVSARWGRLASEQPSELAALIASAAASPGPGVAGGVTLLTTGETRQPAYVVSVGPAVDGLSLDLPTERGAMIFIQAVNSKLDSGFETRMQSLFGLTRKEASLAAALAVGHSLKQAADERFISMATARTQLAQIFRKTSTSQQSQMVSLLLRVLPVTH